MTTLYKTIKVNDVLTNPTSVKLSDVTATFGVKRNDTSAVVVADDTSMTNVSTGVYSYTFTDPADDLTYTYGIEIVYDGETYHIEDTVTGPTSDTASSYALTSITNVKSYLGITASTYDTILTSLVNQVSDAIETYCGRKFKSRAYTMERQDGMGSNFLMVENYPIVSIERIATTTEGALQIQCTDTSAYSATESVTRGDAGLELPANTQLKLSIHGGSNDGDSTAAFGTYTTLITLAAQVNTLTGWNATVIGSFGAWASTELIQHEARECLSTPLVLSVPYQRLDDYEVDYGKGIVRYGIGFANGFQNVYIDYNGGYATIPNDLEFIAIEMVSNMFHNRNVNRSVKSEKIGDYAYTTGEIMSALDSVKDQLTMWRRIQYA